MTLRAVILAICGLIVLSAFAEYAFGHVSGLLIGLQAVVVLACYAVGSVLVAGTLLARRDVT